MPSPPLLPNGEYAKERIGIYGLTGVGKTHQYFKIARWHQDLGSDAVFYGVNTDTSWEVLHSNPEFADLTNLRYKDCTTFQEMFDTAKGYNQLMRQHDWLCIDMEDDAWAFVQDEYARIRAKELGLDFDSLGDLWLEGGETKEYPIKGWDWQYCNGRYRSLSNNYVLRGKGHRMIITRQDQIIQPSAGMKEDPIIKANRIMFTPIGVKPAGQKEDPSRWHTILHIASAGEKAQRVSTAKERWGGRRWMGTLMGNDQRRGEELKDFFLDYLVGVAGWSME